jgi:MFS family permease
MALAAIAPTLAFELAALALVGAASIAFMSTANSTLQLRAQPDMRGRVMALWFVAFQGSTPIGGPIIGAVIALSGARAGLALGAITCVGAALLGLAALRGTPLRSLDRLRLRRAPATKAS